ncbi:MAG: M20 family metallopeptidase [Chloroflexi bacterium]|nr:M20 family metallopeptidase [Chloroflexota bacterium]
MISNEKIESLRAYLQEQLPEYLELLRQMVEVNSFTANWEGVNRLGQETAAMFNPLGFEAELVTAENFSYGKHLVLTRNGRQTTDNKPLPIIGLASHLDTVFPPDEEVRNDFHWRPEGSRIYGPGTLDIKGGTAVIYMMMDALKTIMPNMFEAVTWIILLNSCEEVGEDDFGRLCVQRLGKEALACLVFESGHFRRKTFRLVTGRKGMATYRIEVEGKASHAGTAHERGANAIAQIAEFICQIHNMTDYEQDLTFNVGTVGGGTVMNRVPHFAVSTVEMRAYDMAIYEQGINNILALTDQTNIKSPNGDYICRAQVEITRRTQPWPRNEATERLLQIWQDAGSDLDYVAVREERGGLSDGNHTWAHIPTLDGLGPSGGNAHCSERSDDGTKEQEYLFVPSLVPKTLLNLVGILKLVEQAII